MKASGKTTANISTKYSIIICDAIRNKKLEKAKNLLEGMLAKKASLDGKYFTNASKAFLDLLKTIEANAKQKNMDLDKLFIRIAKADKGYKLVRPKSRAKFRGREAKVTNLTIEVEER